jgi:hypothetical protein
MMDGDASLLPTSAISSIQHRGRRKSIFIFWQGIHHQQRLENRRRRQIKEVGNSVTSLLLVTASKYQRI